MHRPSEPAALTVQVAHSTFMEGECLRNRCRKIADTPSSAIPNDLQAHTGIHENPVLGNPGTSAFPFLTAFGSITAYSPKKSITTNTNRNPARSFICTQNSLPRKPQVLVNAMNWRRDVARPSAGTSKRESQECFRKGERNKVASSLRSAA